MDKKTLTTSEIAKYCQVTQRTVSQWISEGKIEAFKTPGNHSRVAVDNFLNFLKEYNMPVPDDLNNNFKKKTILVVDDDEAMINSIKRTLAKEEMYEIETASDGFVAGQKFVVKKPDLIILDIRMPRVDGYKLCWAVRNDPKNAEVKILVISGIIDDKGADKIIKLGANDYLLKPFDNSVLKEKINGLLGIVIDE